MKHTMLGVADHDYPQANRVRGSHPGYDSGTSPMSAVRVGSAPEHGYCWTKQPHPVHSSRQHAHVG